MNTKVAVSLVFAVFGLVVLPVSIAVHSHLYADGAPLLTAILESGTCDAAHTPARVGHHFMTQAVVTAAVKCGVSDIRYLSWLYGIALFYLPWLAYMLAAWLFVRSHMAIHAVLVALMYCLLACFTSFFIISESHLAAALFILTLATILTCNPGRWPGSAALFVLWLLSVSSYEFWVLFFPACLVILFARSTQPRNRRPYAVLAVLYVLGAVINIYSIVFTTAPDNRAAMFGSHFIAVWRQCLAVSILFLLAILFVISSMWAESRDPRLPAWLHRCITRTQRAIGGPSFLVVLALTAAAGGAGAIFYIVGTPWDAYPLRTLNLILPLIFTSFLYVARTVKPLPPCPAPIPSYQKSMVAGLVALLVVTSGTRIFHALGFLDFQRRLFDAAQSHSGYIAVGDALPGFQRYGWFWTYPAMSLLIQGMQRAPIKAILYNPGMSFQPFGPLDADCARKFASRMQLPIEEEALRVNRASNTPGDLADSRL